MFTPKSSILKYFRVKSNLDLIRFVTRVTHSSELGMENLSQDYDKFHTTDIAAKNIISIVLPDNTSLSARRIIHTTAKQLSLDSLTQTVHHGQSTTYTSSAPERVSTQPNAKAGIASNAPDYSVQLNLMSKSDFIKLQNDRRQGYLHTGLSAEDNFDASVFFKHLDQLRATLPKKYRASVSMPISHIDHMLTGAPIPAQPEPPSAGVPRGVDYHDWRALVEAGEVDDLMREWSTSSTTGYPLGHMLLHAPVAQSSQVLMTTTLSPLPCGLVFVVDTQTSGRGRGGNEWTSPPGCLMSNVSVRVESAHLLPFVQYLLCWALVGAVKDVAPLLDVGIKWPNDVYMNGGKIGGILCQSSMDEYVPGQQPTFTVHAGFGINVTRGGAFGTLNNGIRALQQQIGAVTESKRDTDSDDALPPLEDIPTRGSGGSGAVTAEADVLSREELLARVVHRLALAMPLFNKYGFTPFEREYMQWWQHRGATVRVEGKEGEYVLTGFAPSGYLRAQAVAGAEVLELHPDGNSFDVNQHFIAAKKLN